MDRRIDSLINSWYSIYSERKDISVISTEDLTSLVLKSLSIVKSASGKDCDFKFTLSDKITYPYSTPKNEILIPAWICSPDEWKERIEGKISLNLALSISNGEISPN